ncbi:MAG: hypothetical protein JNM93_07370 [Bacteriovoracaceae bacterium]|nr:hypothetical protein [Bacteriovoracaceae bacterium]
MDILNYFNLHTREFLYIESGLLILLFILIMFYWMYYKKKFQSFKHQIPAGVVKTYLDSVIQNSHSLKSSLFRGEVDPSIMPISSLPDSIEIHTGGAGGSAQLNQKNAEIASLQAAVADKKNLIKELENRLANIPTGETGIDPKVLADLQKQLAAANAEIERLKALLAQKNAAPAAAGGVPQSQYDELKKQKEELEEKLKEYEVIEDDLANLKRLKQENDQLRKSLGQAGDSAQTVSGGNDADAMTTIVSGGSDGDDANTLVSGGGSGDDAINMVAGEAEDTGPVTTDVADAAPAAADAAEGADADKKTPEDLLSEFEKMLG